VLLLAMADPTNLRAHDDLRLALGGVPFRLAVADESQLTKALGRAYRSRIELSVVATDAAEELRRAEDIRDMASSTPTIQLVNSVLKNAIEDGASDLHFEPKRDRVLIRARIDGVLRDVAEVPKHMQPAVISRLKVMGSLDIGAACSQDGRLSVRGRPDRPPNRGPPAKVTGEGPELAAGTTIWRAVGCAACGHSGYRGRVALYEFLRVRGEIRALVEDSTETIFAVALRNGMRTLRSDGMRLCREDVSTLDEIRRVTGDRLT
jgi:type II secretory ATPase GspE/PulE/Tfp pilus assembly ATPase PilB-like protein